MCFVGWCESSVITWEGLLFGANPPGRREPVLVVICKSGLDAHFHRPPTAQGTQGRGRREGQARGGRGGLVQPPAHSQARWTVASLPLVLDEEQDVRQGEGGLALAAGQEVLLQRRVSVVTQPGQPAHG